MKRARTIGTTILAIALAGCGTRVHFFAESEVHSDGSLTRVSRFESNQDLAEEYELPQGVSEMSYVAMTTSYRFWRQDKERTSRSEQPRTAYVGANFYHSRMDIPSDFVRRAPSSDKRAENDIRVRKSSWWFFTTYHYEERYRDIVKLGDAISFLELLRDDGLEFVQAGVPDEISPFVSERDLENAFQNVIAAEIDREIQVLRQQGLSYVYELVQRFDDEEYADRLYERFADELLQGDAPRIAEPGDREDWYEGVWQVLAEPFGDHIEERYESGEIDEFSLFGVHGFEIFDDYDFDIALTMPGTVYATNGDLAPDGALSWQFDYGEFVWKPYTISASSRTIHWGRILTVLIALSIVFGWLIGEFRKSGPSGFDV